MSGVKECQKCKNLLPTTSFWKNKRKPDGLQSYCVECLKETINGCVKLAKDGIKECFTCNLFLPVEKFGNRKTSPDGLMGSCLSCCKKTRQKSYKKRSKAITSDARKNRRNRIAWLRKFKSGKPCTDCGKIYPSMCMDFDHVPGRGKKFKNVSRMVLNSYPILDILEEIAKCDLVCVLCHNIRTRKRYDDKMNKDIHYGSQTRKNFALIKEAKSNPCYVCGAQRELCNMEFDHINKEEKFHDICQLKGVLTVLLVKELEKVKPICSLCHRMKSIFEQQIKNKNNIPDRKCSYPAGQAFCMECKILKNIDLFPKQLMNKKTRNGYCDDCATRLMTEYDPNYKKRKKKVK